MQDDLLIIILLSVTAVVLSTWLTRLFCHPAARFQILDHPNERSLHERPTPRSGGLAIVAAVFLAGLAGAVAYRAPLQLLWIGLGALAVVVVSFLDDRMDLSPLYRLSVHAAAAGLLVYAGVGLSTLALPGFVWPLSAPAGAALSFLFVVWMVNLYNFMDGMDGFAGGMAVIGFGTLALLGWLAGSELFAALNAIVAAAAAGFLVFNFPPARIFMGDVGSSTLGLLAAAFSLWGAREGVFPFWVAVLVFSPFIVDATVTLARRLYRGEKIWQAHKTHYYQRLVQLGWGHRKTVLWEYVIMLACALSALWVVSQSDVVQWLVIAGWTILYTGFAWFVSRLERATGRPDS